MATYRITEKFPTYASVEIEADSAQEAITIWDAGSDWDYNYYSDYDSTEFSSVKEV